MGINIDLSQLVQKPRNLLMPRPIIKPSKEILPPQISLLSEAKITISQAARQLASSDKSRAISTEVTSRGINAIIEPGLQLRELLKQYDFHSITPRQMAHLSGELFARGEISDEASGAFIGTENDTNVLRSLDEPMDMVAHFQMLSDSVEISACSDSTLAFGVAYSKHVNQSLADIVSFVESDRDRIATNQGVNLQDLEALRRQQHIDAAMTLLKYPPRSMIRG